MNKELVVKLYTTLGHISCSLIGALVGYLSWGFIGASVGICIGIMLGKILEKSILSDLI